MKTIFTALSLVIFLSFNINPITKGIKIDENYKIESTFSGNTEGENSFHLIIAKKKDDRSYDIIPFLFSDGNVTNLKPINFQNMPSVFSFHNNEGTLSLITKFKEKSKDEFFSIIDIDLKSDTHIKSKDITAEDFSTFIRRKDKNILVFSKEESIDVIDVSSSNDIKSISVKPNEQSKAFFKELSKSQLDAVNNQDYVANGSIGKFRVYEDDGKLFFTKEESKTDKTEVVIIPLNVENSTTVGSRSFSNGEEDYKKNTSYVANGKLFQLKLKKKDLNLKIHSLTDETSKSLGINDIKTSTKGDDFEGMESFLKQASKGSNSPTITINETKNKNLRVRVDYVNNATYNYHYNWWWHHHWHWQFHQQMMQQQMMRQVQQNIPRFGPSVEDEIIPFIPLKSNKSYFEFTVNHSNDFVNDDNSDSMHQEIDKKKYIDVLDENTKLKHTSTVFTKEKFRYMAYNKKTKTFEILEKPLDD